MQLDVVRDIVDLGDPSPDSVQGQARYARVVPRDGHKVVHRPPLRQCRGSWDEMSSGGLPCIKNESWWNLIGSTDIDGLGFWQIINHDARASAFMNGCSVLVALSTDLWIAVALLSKTDSCRITICYIELHAAKYVY